VTVLGAISGPEISPSITHSYKHRPFNDIANGDRQQVPPKEIKQILPSMKMCIITRKDKLFHTNRRLRSEEESAFVINFSKTISQNFS
jgi:hypothetical protein